MRYFGVNKILVLRAILTISEAVAEVGVSDCGGGIFDGVAERFFFAYEDAKSAGTAYSCVEEIAIKHRAVGKRDWEDYVLYLGALEFMDSCGITQGQFAQFTAEICAAVAVGIFHYHCLLFRIHFYNPARLAVVDSTVF